MDKTATYELGLTVAGRAKLWVNGKITIDNWTNQRPGDFFYGSVTLPYTCSLIIRYDLSIGKGRLKKRLLLI